MGAFSLSRQLLNQTPAVRDAIVTVGAQKTVHLQKDSCLTTSDANSAFCFPSSDGKSINIAHVSA